MPTALSRSIGVETGADRRCTLISALKCTAIDQRFNAWNRNSALGSSGCAARHVTAPFQSPIVVIFRQFLNRFAGFCGASIVQD
jgi:hypothetical protein